MARARPAAACAAALVLLVAPLLPVPSAAGPPFPSPCFSDADCQFNGVCDLADNTCICSEAWGGPNCAVLALQPSERSAFGTCDGTTLNGTAYGAITTWGGLPVQDTATGYWHLHPAEMANNCGMTAWASQSQVGHWVSTTGVAGPYVRKGTAVGTFAHNPTVIAAPPGTPAGVNFLLFHIGMGCETDGPHPCNYTAIPFCENGTTPGHPPGHSPYPIPTPPNLTWGHTHVASSLDGPWLGLPYGWTTPACPNNPAPLFLPNGSLIIFCHTPMAPGLSCPTSGGLSYAVSATANWTHGEYVVRCLNLLNPSFSPPNGSGGDPPVYVAANEDPHAYMDANGILHILTHNQGPGYLNLSWFGGDVRGDGGHFFSADMGETWTFQWHAVYSGLVLFTDGQERRYKRERPKLVQDPITLRPIALASGVGVELVDAFAPYNDSACTMVALVGAT